MIKWLTFVCLGDSLTVGYQTPHNYKYSKAKPYPEVLERITVSYIKENANILSVVFINKGINGDSTDGMIGRLPRIIQFEKPDYVIIWAGINDLYIGRNLEIIIRNIVKLVDKCIESKAQPIICNLAPVVGSMQFNQVIRECNLRLLDYCSKHNLYYVDLFSALATRDGQLEPVYSDDGVHLSNEGYCLVAKIIFNTAVKPVLASMMQRINKFDIDS